MRTFKSSKKIGLILLLLCGIASAVLYAYNQQQPIKQGDISMVSNQKWSLQQAYQVMSKAANPSYGLTDEKALAVLKKQAESGDLNAGFTYARALSFIIPFQFKGKELETQLKNNAKMFDTLAKLGHPPSAEYVAENFYGFGRTDIQKVSGFSYDEYFKEVEKYYRIAVNAEMRNSAESFAMLLIIGNDHLKSEERSMYRPISPYKNTANFTRQKEAMQLFESLANKGSLFGAAHLAEGYIHGIGVEKNVVKAYSWSKLAVSRGENYIENQYAVWECNQFLKHLPSMSSAQLAEAEALFNQLNSSIPAGSEYEAWKEGIPNI